MDRRPLAPTQYSDIAIEGLDLYAGSAPAHITQTAPGIVTIFPFAAGTVSLSVFLKPRHGQDFANPANTEAMQDYLNQVPDFLLTQWAEPIAAGALSRVLMIPGQQWTDPKMGAFRLQQFNNACDSHFSQNIVGQQRAPRRTRPNYL